MKKIYLFVLIFVLSSFTQKKIKLNEINKQLIEYLQATNDNLHFLKTEISEEKNYTLTYVRKEDYEKHPLEDLIVEYYYFNSNNIIQADLNNDEYLDVIVKIGSGAFESRSWGYSFLIGLNFSGKLKFIPNNFRGNDISDIESITKVENGIIYTNLLPFNEEKISHDTLIENYKKYKLVNNKIIEYK